jgi:hypothetical protein
MNHPKAKQAVLPPLLPSEQAKIKVRIGWQSLRSACLATKARKLDLRDPS